MRASDAVALALLVLGFASFVTAHVCILVGLSSRPPRWRTLVALVVVPAALYWAARERMWTRAAVWSLGIVLYVVGRFVAAA